MEDKEKQDQFEITGSLLVWRWNKKERLIQACAHAQGLVYTQIVLVGWFKKLVLYKVSGKETSIRIFSD